MYNVQLGIFVGDNESCAIDAARTSDNYEIVKFDDLNRTGKVIKSELYKYIKSFKELTATTIKYLECGDWCDYKKDPDSYERKIIGKVFQYIQLLETLTNISNNLAQKASWFSAETSSNSNESFNAMVASKSSKSKMYGMTKKCQLSSGIKIRRFRRRLDESSKRKYEKIN
ncbi:hypothetical protein PV327_008768 [Microctonus hyperodae]|uniref:Uncharacterized protein n=1 Tax=Microctonus hyperodae TaxID=165561 RepID=A0AA39FSF8_MICHY|nr:hypothetical protein PV327_008768 [Microctonus hyperodae]